MILRLRTRERIFLPLILLFLFWGCNKASDPSQIAPDFTLKDLSGQAVGLKQYKGHIVLLDFWATWCPPCRLSVPELVNLQKKYRDQGVVILGISMDDPRTTGDKALLAFRERFKINYKILRGEGGVAWEYFGTRNMALPTLFVIDREGRIVDKIVGYVPGVVEKSIITLLR